MKMKFLYGAILCLFLGVPVSAHAQMVLKSTDISEDATLSNAQVFKGFDCKGGNISPALSWENVPYEAKSLALTVYDPDAPTGSGWWHWVAFNIPVTATSLPAGASKNWMPEGTVESMTDFGSVGFGGACPRVGDAPHHYVFKLYALNVEKLDLDEKASGAMVGYFLNSHSIEKASIVTTYGR